MRGGGERVGGPGKGRERHEEKAEKRGTKRDREAANQRPKEKTEKDGERQERNSVQFNLLQPTQRSSLRDGLKTLTGMQG